MVNEKYEAELALKRQRTIYYMEQVRHLTEERMAIEEYRKNNC